MKKGLAGFLAVALGGLNVSTVFASDGSALVQEIMSHIENDFYKKVDMKDCAEKVLKRGVSACADRYSFYLTDQEVKEENEQFLKGEFAGIGAQLEMKKGVGAMVWEVFDDSPAKNAGLAKGDLVVAVSSSVSGANNPNWVLTKRLDLKKTVEMIRGPAGTNVMLRVVRNKVKMDFVITREIVKIQFLKSKKIGSIGYIQVKEFAGENLFTDFYSTLSDFREQNIKTVIIDLRNNPGGLVMLVTRMAVLFQRENKPILFYKNRNDDSPKIEKNILGILIVAAHSGDFKDFKVVILQNEHSASASEIFSDYLKEYCGAVVVGKKSYGKGIVQSLFGLKNGGELHLTVSEYFLGERLIKVHGIGIKPTIEVNNPKKVKSEADDLQLKKAIEEAKKLDLRK